MEDEIGKIAISFHSLLVVCLALIGWFIRYTFNNVLDKIKENKNNYEQAILTVEGHNHEVEDSLKEHINKCNEVPKSLIVEKIDNLADKMDTNQEEFKEFRKEMKEEVGFQRKRYHDLNNTLMTLAHKE